ncbi:hypothetical protein Syun_012409 [Stephania yunnanensis]|uniref:NAC domain-containing protein n=1 Tax=Stephania yunnanensis TaxID=152371 RepID=A0AAP0K068_9MAGN
MARDEQPRNGTATDGGCERSDRYDNVDQAAAAAATANNGLNIAVCHRCRRDYFANNGNPTNKDVDYFRTVPAGYRFSPTDQELLEQYLFNKIKNLTLTPNNIVIKDIYECHPAHSINKYSKYEEREWYFFSTRDQKYLNGIRPNRAAGETSEAGDKKSGLADYVLCKIYQNKTKPSKDFESLKKRATSEGHEISSNNGDVGDQEIVVASASPHIQQNGRIRTSSVHDGAINNVEASSTPSTSFIAQSGNQDGMVNNSNGIYGNNTTGSFLLAVAHYHPPHQCPSSIAFYNNTASTNHNPHGQDDVYPNFLPPNYHHPHPRINNGDGMPPGSDFLSNDYDPNLADFAASLDSSPLDSSPLNFVYTDQNPVIGSPDVQDLLLNDEFLLEDFVDYGVNRTEDEKKDEGREIRRHMTRKHKEVVDEECSLF